jgi:hypothetical protein
MENASFETASVLKQAGVSVALQTGSEGHVPRVRVLLSEAAAAAACSTRPLRVRHAPHRRRHRGRGREPGRAMKRSASLEHWGDS